VDRARRDCSSRLERWGGDLKHPIFLVVLLAACTVITGDLGRTIAIEIEGELVKRVEEDDTITLSARAIDAAGDTVSDAIVIWELLDADAGFDLDSLTGVVQATFPGSGRARARVEELRSDTISILVTGAPDSIAADGDTVVTMASDAEESPPLTTVLIDLTTDSAAAQPLAEKEVSYTLVDPAPGAPEALGFFLTVSDSVPGLDPHAVEVTTDGASQAFIVLKRVAGAALPDSVFVDAVALTAVGDTVAGSPVKFVVVIGSVP
jgi:hypothetical protein